MLSYSTGKAWSVRYIFLLCYHLCVYVPCTIAYVEVRGQHGGVNYILPPCITGIELRISGLVPEAFAYTTIFLGSSYVTFNI